MFQNYYNKINFNSINEFIITKTENDVKNAINKETLDINDFASLLSPAAEKFMKIIIEKSHLKTISNFGRTIQLYAPLYISNFCSNECLYCGFSSSNNRLRKKLTLEEIENEAIILSKTGIKHVIILTGEAPDITPLEYISNAIKILKKYFASVSIEIFPLEENEYKFLINSGIDGVTIYQETYDKSTYEKVHLKGKKTDFYYRLNTPDRCAKAGVRHINIGALFGLSSPLVDGFLAGLHAYYLINKYPEIEFSISIPRLHWTPKNFILKESLKDNYFIQILTAYRLFLQTVGITISTREHPNFRDTLIGIGATRFSAGSKTTVGGYSSNNEELSQFDINDKRSINDFINVIKNKGYDPIFKNWDIF